MLPPSEIRDSGGGFHPVWHLKEPLADAAGLAEAEAVMKRLACLLAADPAPTHCAALLRHPGTHNSKYGESIECRVIESSGAAYDISEFVDLFDLYGDTPLLHYSEKSKSNGHDKGTGAAKTPVDVTERFATMRFKGEGESAVHLTQLQCTGSLLRAGCDVDWTVDEVLAATRKAVADDDRCKEWDWAQEEWGVREMCYSHINKNPELCELLPDTLLTKWKADLAEGKQPRIIFSKGRIGWHVRGLGAKDTPEAEKRDAPAGESPGPQAAARRVLVLRPFIPFDPATLPPREWLYGKHYQRRTVSLTAGPGGMGKSSLVLVEAIAMATARNLLGEQPTERLRVWLHNGEDPLEEINRRIAAICLHHGIPQEELRGQLWITSGKEFPLRVANGYSNLKIDTVLVRQISGAIKENQIDVADFDPLVTLHSVSEGDPGKMDAVIRIFADLADEHDASIELNHHVRKPAAGMEADHDVFDIRGVMAISDATRAARVLNRMNKADAENAGIGDVERQSYFRVDRAKGNYSLAQASVWRRFVEVTLPNPTADSVGVVEAWEFPGQGVSTPKKAAADQEAERVFLLLLNKFADRGVNVSANQGPTYAPNQFAKEQEAKKAHVSKAALTEAMRRLLDTGRIRSEAARADGRFIAQKMHEQNSPYRRIRRGEYALQETLEAKQTQQVLPASDDEPITGAIRAFGMYWQRQAVNWKPTMPQLWGLQSIGASKINFAEQIGIYLLHDRDRVMYVGQATDILASRLRSHITDKLGGRWDRFSWFGLRGVDEEGQLSEASSHWTHDILIDTLEALLIESLEPPLNRKRGNDLSAIEYLQEVDPEIDKQRKQSFLGELGKLISSS